jgi:hypothetical protein
MGETFVKSHGREIIYLAPDLAVEKCALHEITQELIHLMLVRNESLAVKAAECADRS